ncbi:AAA family ATPase [Desulfococcaceae bacterium HSG8]|nr:AAA family ATPase [Desulfococcaceae bacterium HSG8]
MVIEAKHPKQNLDHHVRKLRYYLSSLLVRYGLLTNGKELRIYERGQNGMELVFRCAGEEISDKIEKIKSLVGRENTKPKPARAIPRRVSRQKPRQERKDMMKIIAVYHNKGGVGKTTVVVNLAAALSRKGKRVLVVDLDSQANTTFATGLIKFSEEDDDDIRDCNIGHTLEKEDFFHVHEITKKSQFNTPEVDVIPSHINLMDKETDLDRGRVAEFILVDKLNAVEAMYDIVIIDTPPSLNLFARIPIFVADYLIIPSDLKPFANQGLTNVKKFVKNVNNHRRRYKKEPIEVWGVLPSKISTNSKFTKHTLPERIRRVKNVYGMDVMDSCIYQREVLAQCTDHFETIDDQEMSDPKSVFEFKPNSQSAEEFESLADEVMKRIGEF